MAAGWVLLNRCVEYTFDDDDDEPSRSVAAAAEVINSTWGDKAASSIAPPIQPMLAVLMRSLKPAADAVADLPSPPEIATFRLRASKSHRGSLSSTSLVACADQGLLVLYGGRYYGPGSSMCGCYLVYDAAAGAAYAARLSTVPPVPEPRCVTYGVGSGAVVVRRHPAGGPSSSSSSTFLLAELAVMPNRRLPDPDAALLLWRSAADEDQPTPTQSSQWVRKEVHLPREARLLPAPGDDKHGFVSDVSFAGPGGCLCWVDLLQGIVVCADPEDPELRFIPFPDGCPGVSYTDYPYRPSAEENRSAAYVGGCIRLVSMVGELEGWHAEQYRLTTWTLSPPPSSLSSPGGPDDDDDVDITGGGWRWREDGVFPLVDLWATEEFQALGLPPQTPVCPVLSAARDVCWSLIGKYYRRVFF